MRSEQMTPKERMAAFARGEALDHIPLVPDMGVTMSDFLGYTTKEYYFSAAVMAETEIALFKHLRHDSVSISTTLRGMAEAMGTTIKYPEDNISLLDTPVVQSEEDIAKLKVIDPEKDGKLPLLLEALERIRDAIGDEADIGASMTAPFSVAASVIGTENLLRWMVRKPEAVHRVMEMVTLCNEQYIKALGRRGFGTGFCDPVSSTSLLKVKQFQEFSLPYMKRNVQHVIEYCGSKPTMHICGYSKELWPDVVATGIGNFSIDNCESLTEAKEIMGEDVVITGNVPPVDVMYLGTPEDVEQSVIKCILEGYDSPKGYILCTGCQIPKGTPIENIDRFMEAGRKYGSLPIDPERLQKELRVEA